MAVSCGFLNGINSSNTPEKSSIKSWDLTNQQVSCYLADSGYNIPYAEEITGCGTTESVETFANQAQYKMKVFNDKNNVKHLIPNWIPDEVAGKIFE